MKVSGVYGSLDVIPLKANKVLLSWRRVAARVWGVHCPRSLEF